MSRKNLYHTLKILLPCIFLLFPFSLKAQNTDSLIAALPSMKDDTNKISVLNTIIRSYTFGDIDKQIPYIEMMYRISYQIDYPKGIARAHLSYANYYYRTSQWDKAIPFLEKSDSIYSAIGDPASLAAINNMWGIYYTEIGRYEKAMSMHQLALDYCEKMHNTAMEAATLGVITKLFFTMRRYEDSEAYGIKTVNKHIEIGNKKGLSIAMLNMATLYFEQERYKDAEFYVDQVLKLEQELNDIQIIAKALMFRSHFQTSRKQYQQAIDILQQTYVTFSEVHDTIQMGYNRMYLAYTYNSMGEPEKAIKIMAEGIQLARQGGADSVIISDFDRQYYVIYKGMGDYENALKYYERLTTNQSSLFSSQTANKISELKEKYETEKKEQENTALRNEKEIRDLRLQRQWYLIYGLAGFFILVILLFILLIRTNRIIADQKNMRLEQKLLRSQMNPHFVFNSLTAIQSYVFKNDPKSAGKFLSSFAKLMRGILENSREEYISLHKEINWLQNYVELQKLRFENRFEYTIEIDPLIDQENLLIPPMLTQPFIENSLEHGLNEKEYGGMLNISFIKAGDDIQVKITDNGKGFDQDVKTGKNNERNSLATIITRERLELLNRNRKRKIVFTINSSPGNGTIVIFHIPNKTKY